jgi:hypothetical protein
VPDEQRLHVRASPDANRTCHLTVVKDIPFLVVAGFQARARATARLLEGIMIREIALAGALLVAGTSVQVQAGDAAVGGLFGAGAGALLGGAITGKAGGAVAGALLGGATGAVVAGANDGRPRYREAPRPYYPEARVVYREAPRGEYFSSRYRCFFEYPDGAVVQVADHPC